MAVTELLAVIVKLQVLAVQAAADPVPPEKMPGVDGEGTLAERVRAVPTGIENTHVPGATGLQT